VTGAGLTSRAAVASITRTHLKSFLELHDSIVMVKISI
jgi:hypothetical protein